MHVGEGGLGRQDTGETNKGNHKRREKTKTGKIKQNMTYSMRENPQNETGTKNAKHRHSPLYIRKHSLDVLILYSNSPAISTYLLIYKISVIISSL